MNLPPQIDPYFQEEPKLLSDREAMSFLLKRQLSLWNLWKILSLFLLSILLTGLALSFEGVTCGAWGCVYLIKCTESQNMLSIGESKKVCAVWQDNETHVSPKPGEMTFIKKLSSKDLKDFIINGRRQ
jgi:hypothetical protein